MRGTVRSLGSAVRITAELIAAEDGFLVWAERWERPNEDVFRIHEEIAVAVSGALRSHMSAPRSSPTATPDREAHDLYLKGRFYWNQRTEHGFRRAIEHYEAALARDPGFARVHAALADTWVLMSAHHLEKSSSSLAKAKAFAVEALRLDPELAASHSALAATLLFYDRKPREARMAWEHALQLDPNYAYAWHGVSVFGSFVWRRLDEALAAIQQARRLEPLSAPIACDVGFTFYANGEYEQAIQACHAAIDLHPSFSRTYVCLARAHAARGQYEVSTQTCIQGRPLFTGRAFFGQLLATQAYSYARLGRGDDARRILHELEGDSAEHFVSLMDMAIIHTGMGNAALAIDLLERANAAGEHWSISIPTEPLLHSLHSEPRFRSLAARVFEPLTFVSR